MNRLAPLVAHKEPDIPITAVDGAERRPAAEHIGIGVHKNQSQICIITSEGELIEKRVSTERERFEVVLGSYPETWILIEASTESEWVARCLEGLGHEVIVADPNYAPMYGRTHAASEDGSAGCARAGGGVPQRDVSAGASNLR